MARDWVVYGSTPLAATWLHEQNVAHALAARGRVLYVDPPMSPLTPLRGSTPPSTLIRRRPEKVGRLESFRPIALPPLEHPLARRRSVPLVRRQIAAVVRRLGMRAPVVVAGRWTPGLEGAAGEALRIGLVLDWTPAGAHLLGREAAALESEIDATCRASDVTVVISEALRATLAERGCEAVVIPHGFPADLRADYDAASPAQQVLALPGPRLGYVGTIDARLDFDALARLAAERPDASLILVGPVSPLLAPDVLERLRALPNVHLLGAVQRAEVPAHLVALDCLLMPYVEDEWGRHGSPLKLWEYLYAGPPIAATGYTALSEYGPRIVHFASPPARLPEAVAAALGSDTAERESRRTFAAQNTWDDRAAEFEELAERALAGQGRAPL